MEFNSNRRSFIRKAALGGLKQAPGIYWTNDGVHPSLAGAQLMARAWLTAIK